MGLLDAMTTDTGLMGLLLMQAGAAKPQRTSFGEGLLSAVQGVQQYKQAQEDRALKQQLTQAQLDEYKAQAQQRQAQTEELKRKQLEAQRIQAALQAAISQQQGQPLGTAQDTPPGYGQQQLGAAGASDSQQPQRPLGAYQRNIDYQALLAQGVPPELVKHLADARNYGRDEVTRTIETTDSRGMPVTVQFDKYGNRVGGDLRKPVELKMQDLGGKVAPLNPFTGAVSGASLNKTMTPGEIASNGLGYARLNFDKQKDMRDAAAGQLVETPNGYVRVGKDNTSQIVMAPGGTGQLVGKGGNMTEDQAKATGWLVQAQNAYKNMLATGFDASGNPKSAAYPGIPDALEKVPGVGALANGLRTADRQKFMQASSSLSEALLRAATGAGVNKDEASQKVRELTPVFGEDEGTTRQKMAAIPQYIESLKIRSGPGASKAAGIGAAPAPSGGVKFLGFE